MEHLLERVEKLEKSLSALACRVEQLEAHRAIESLMAKHQLYLAANRGEEIVQELWSHDDAISLEYGASGVYEMPWKVRTFYVCDDIPGVLSVSALSTQSITVHGDGTTASGTWFAIGVESDAGELGISPPAPDQQRQFLLSSATADGKKYQAEWLWQRYAVEFVKEGTQWKIQKLRVGEFFRCPFDQDWVLFATERFKTDGMWLEEKFSSSQPLPEISHGENIPSAATTEHWQYRVDARAKELLN